MQEESRQAFHEAGDKRGESDTLCNLGNVLVERGELQLAMQRYDEAIATARNIGYKAGLAAYLTQSVDVFLGQDQLKKAGERAQQSLALRREMGATIGTAQSQFVLAEIAFEQGQLPEAETLLRTAAPKFEERNKSDLATQTAALSARLLLAQSKSAESRARGGSRAGLISTDN